DEKGLARSSRRRPMAALLPSDRRRLLAARLCRYSRRSMAARTREASSPETAGSPLITRDTVFRLTPARAATSRIVGLVRVPESTAANVGPPNAGYRDRSAW